MKTSPIANVNRKLTSGTEVIFNSKIAWVEHDRQDGFISLRTTKEKQHKEDNTFLISKSEIKLSPKLKSGISAKPKPATEQQKKDSGDLNSFFDSLADKIPFNCTNCRKPLYAFSKKAKRSVCAHIFAKAQFKSIATNPDNILFMGADYIGCPCNCHDVWDRNLDSRKKLTRAYDIAVKRLELLKPFMTQKEIIMAYDYLGMQEGKA